MTVGVRRCYNQLCYFVQISDVNFFQGKETIKRLFTRHFDSRHCCFVTHHHRSNFGIVWVLEGTQAIRLKAVKIRDEINASTLFAVQLLVNFLKL